MSVVVARRAIEKADVAVLVIDSVEGATDQDGAIAGEADRAGCGIVIAANGLLRGLQDTKTPLLVAGIGFLVNIGLNFVLVYGLDLSVAGSAMGTSLVQWGMAAVYLVIVYRGSVKYGVPLAPTWTGVKATTHVGSWLMLRTLSLRVAILATGARYGALGVIGRGEELSDFITHGLSEAEHAAIGELPRVFRLLEPVARNTARRHPIDGSSGPRAIVQSLRLASDALARGEVVCIFAEGRFTRTGLLKVRAVLERLVDDRPRARDARGRCGRLGRALAVISIVITEPLAHAALRIASVSRCSRSMTGRGLCWCDGTHERCPARPARSCCHRSARLADGSVQPALHLLHAGRGPGLASHGAAAQ